MPHPHDLVLLVVQVSPSEEVDYKRTPTEGRLAIILYSFISTLVVVPGHPEYGPFYLVKVRDQVLKDPLR